MYVAARSALGVVVVEVPANKMVTEALKAAKPTVRIPRFM
jgi:hypothetical protein